MPRQNLIKYCNSTIRFSLYAIAFYIPVSIAIIESFAGLAIAAWLFKKIIAREGLRTVFQNNFLTLPVLFYFFVCVVSSFFSSNQAISFRHLILKTLEYLLIFFITVEVADRKFSRNIAIVLIISASLVGIDGIFQYFTNRDFFRGRGPVIIGRINGPFTAPTDFANYLVSLLPLVVSLCFLKFKKIAFGDNRKVRFSAVRKVFYAFLRHKRIWAKLLLITLSAVIFVSIILSASRSAWIALISAMPLAWIFLGKKRIVKMTALIILLIFFSAIFHSDIAKERIAALFNKDSRATMFLDRPHMLETGYNMFLDRPVIGQGLGTFMYNFIKFRPFIKNNPYGDGPCYAHNCFLQIAAETGLVGLFSFLMIIAVLFGVSLRLIRRAERVSFSYYVFSGLNIGIFTYLVGSFFDTNLYSLPLAVLFWLMLGLTVAYRNVIKGS